MRSTLASLGLASVVLAAGASAQVIVTGGGCAPVGPVMAPAACPAVVPVAPVAYAAPVYYAPQNVLYIGPPGGYSGNYYAGTGGYGYARGYCYSPNVVYFGRQEGWFRGYQFTRAR